MIGIQVGEEDVADIAPGRFVEVCGALARGQAIDWRFGSDAALDFNIHYHQGKQVLYPTRRDGVARAEGRLEVEVPQDYCWMWTNKSASPTSLRVQLGR